MREHHSDPNPTIDMSKLQGTMCL